MALGEGSGRFTFGNDAREAVGSKPKIIARKLSVAYGEKVALDSVSLEIPEAHITALIGPSGCGKSTFVRSINRMNDSIDGARTDGRVEVGGKNVYDKDVDPVILRSRVGMIFQKPNPFPKSIYENVAYGVRIHGLAKNKADRDTYVERALRRAGLWDEVKDRLQQQGTALSGGQQQRLVTARALAVNPEVILMDEPCSALDHQATTRFEENLNELRGEGVTIAIVTHNMQQAARVSQKTAFFHLGKIVEAGPTEEIFTNPKDSRTQDYITGRFG